MADADLWADLGANLASGFLEIDEAFVPAGDWVQAKQGNREAIERLQKFLDGITLYEHALIPEANWVKVTLRDLCAARIIQSIVLSKNP